MKDGFVRGNPRCHTQPCSEGRQNEEQASAFEDSDLYNANGVLVGPYIKLVGDHFEPIAQPKKGFDGWMYGGNDVVVDGVRYRLHDRQESRSEYLSYK